MKHIINNITALYFCARAELSASCLCDRRQAVIKTQAEFTQKSLITLRWLVMEEMWSNWTASNESPEFLITLYNKVSFFNIR